MSKDFLVEPIYTYKAKLVRVIDGDTVDLEIDVGFHMKATQRCRLYGIDTLELDDKEEIVRGQARIAKDYTETYLTGKTLLVKTEKTDSFGRWIAMIWAPDSHGKQQFFNALLVKEGYAKIYMDRIGVMAAEIQKQ